MADISALTGKYDTKKLESELPSTSLDDNNLDTLCIDGYICPKRFLHQITPMEFEELVVLFKQYDVDHSDTLDKHEIRKVLHSLGQDDGLDRAEQLLDIIDEDRNGTINFEEFCRFIVMLKEGDSRLNNLQHLLNKIHDTPLGALDKQAKLRDLKTKFIFIDSKEAEVNTPPRVILELTVTGDWYEYKDGRIERVLAVKRFQGVGPSIREAKYAAAAKAMLKLGSAMPGVKYKEGDFPEEWVEWIDENLLRGVEPVQIVQVLMSKGFHPNRNALLMQRFIVWDLFDIFLKRYPDIDQGEEKLLHDPRFQHWVRATASRGIDGEVILRVMRDRGVDILALQAHFAQILKNNELGSLLDKNGKPMRFLDFYLACEEGMNDVVSMYCRCHAPVNEEAMNQKTSNYQTPLELATMGGHLRVMLTLINHKADVNSINRRGRTPLHIAAQHGHKKACELLLGHGAQFFARDSQGNTALHLAAMFNQVSTVDYLCFKGQSLTRDVASNKVRIRAGTTFEGLVEEVFQEFPRTKLSVYDVLRFEKVWLGEAVDMFLDKADELIRPSLCRPNAALVSDVLDRYDPRPESGIYIRSSDPNVDQIYIPTIASAADLTSLIRRMLQSSALNAVNNNVSTALHVACEANKIRSHQKVIGILVDGHGADLMVKDRQGRKPIDLLMLDKRIPNAPSATQLKEELLFERRVGELKKLSEQFEAEERLKLVQRREAIMRDCWTRADNPSKRVWDAMREGSVLKGKYGEWEMYEDGDSLNLFLCQMIEDSPENYCWEVPVSAERHIHRSIALFLLRSRSSLLRTLGPWTMYRCTPPDPNTDFYHNAVTDETKFIQPAEASWKILQRKAFQVEILGLYDEWAHLKDEFGNSFFRNQITKECFWDRPLNAVSLNPRQKLCTAFQRKKRSYTQKWYTCDECSGSWGKNTTKAGPRFCETCAFRCHQKHRGVRFVRTSAVICNCEEAGGYSSNCCQSNSMTAEQQAMETTSRELQLEEARRTEHNLRCPPVLAFVPPQCPASGVHSKLFSGWRLCRLCPRPSPSELSVPEKQDSDDDERSVVSEISHSNTVVSSSTMKSVDSVYKTAMEERVGQILGSVLPSLPLTKQQSQLLVEDWESLFEAQCMNQPRSGWLEVLDPEEPLELDIGSRVLVEGRETQYRRYGTVMRKEERRNGFYVVLLDVGGVEIVSRERMEALERRVFYFNTTTGQSGWSFDRIYSSQHATYSGDAWLDIVETSSLRRVFPQVDEMSSISLQSVFYVNPFILEREKAALIIQKLIRQRRFIPYPFHPWTSRAFSFVSTREVIEDCKDRAAWAYLRRRSSMLGEFKDEDNREWEEYMDNQTTEYFYWAEDDNAYQWDKPAIMDRSKVQQTYLSIGDEVLYMFPGETRSEIAIVKALRFDDENGSDYYDLQCKSRPEDKVHKWVSRVEIKRVPPSSEELKILVMENQWRAQLRRQREADERKKIKAKELKMQIQMDKLTVVKTAAAQQKLVSAMGDSVKVARGRVARTKQERLDVEEEQEKYREKARAEQVKMQVERAIRSAHDSGTPMTRAEVLMFTRTVEMKMEAKEKLERQRKLQRALNERKKQSQFKAEVSEHFLREMEMPMTSPRSLARRQLIRQLHFGMQRQSDKFIICEWGCGDWVKIGYEQMDHQRNRCNKRIRACPLGCPLMLSEEDWNSPYKQISQEEKDELALNASATDIPTEEDLLESLNLTVKQHHEEEECPKRLVSCPKHCHEFVVFEDLEKHLTESCTKRPAQQITCRLGCGLKFGGSVELLIQSENERILHEMDECLFRMVRCNWLFEDGRSCAAQVVAKDRNAHRDFHLAAAGTAIYLVPGTYTYRVPARVSRLKVQVWGGGGGSGFFKHRMAGKGGGGAFVEALINVEQFSILEVVVASGGQGGCAATTLPSDNGLVDVLDKHGTALGGQPGGGDGFGGHEMWGAGGGGGYSMISLRTSEGSQALVVASGGGGGSTNHGLGGGGLDGFLPGERVDPRNGTTASCTAPGEGGFSGNTHTSAWPASPGEPWKGGGGSEFGGGGGGGYFGGGGGGTIPGLGGGGGGGASYVFLPSIHDFVVVAGMSEQPGGIGHDAPAAVGLGEWDKVGGPVGKGGEGSNVLTVPGNNGAVRIYKPGFF